MKLARIVALCMLLTAASMLAASSASATYPGKNGPIVFVMSGDIWRVNGDGTGLKRITRFSGEERDPAISPNGRLLAFTAKVSGEGEQVFVSDLKGKNLRWVTRKFTKGAPSPRFYWPMWSKDGKRLIMGCTKTLEGNEFCSTTLSTKKQRLKKLTRCDCYHGVSSNQADVSVQNVVASGIGDANENLATFPASGGTPSVIFRESDAGTTDGIYEASWAPSGGEIAFQFGENNGVYAVDSMGGNLRRIVGARVGQFDASHFGSPSYAPDGSRIVVLALNPDFAGEGGYPRGLYSVNPNNPDDVTLVFRDELRRLTQYADPSWGPAPK